MEIQSRLKIALRHHQLTSNEDGSNVIVECNIDGQATYVPGDVDATWYDFTNSCDGLDALQLSWDAQNQGASSQTQTIPSGSNFDKGISLELTFFGDAFHYIWNWLLDNPCQILNAIDVRITDALCDNQFRLFEIKVDNLQYSPYNDCQFSIRLREQDLTWACIHRTFIWDNWQNWFINESAKQHPCFAVAIDPRPRILNSVRMGFHMFLMGMTFGIFERNENNVRKILGVDNYSDAPLVRDYIANVCNKCGIAMDTIFTDPSSPYYNLCLFYPSNGAFHKNEEGTTSPALWYHFENRWDITIDELLDKLKIPFCAEWYVTPNNTLLFKPLDYFVTLAPIYDFTLPGAFKINEDLVYTFDGEKKAAYGRYQYQVDGSDLASQEIKGLYNDIVQYDQTTNNPMLEGDTTKTIEFAATAFVRDGRSEDYIRLLINDGRIVAQVLLAILIVLTLAVTGVATIDWLGVILAGVVVAAVELSINSRYDSYSDEFLSEEYDGIVRMTFEQTMLPRLLLWDGESMNRAKVVKEDALPTPNTYYNATSTPFDQPIPTDANGFPGNSISEDNPDSNVYNYPMYFKAGWNGNLYDRFHDDVDNPLKSLETNQSFQFTTELCCDAMTVFGLWADQYPKIGYVIKLEQRANYAVYGRIKHIDVDYNRNVILLKGKVIKR